MEDREIARFMAKVLSEAGLEPTLDGCIVTCKDGAARLEIGPAAGAAGFWSVQLTWDGELDGEDYLAALPVANSICTDHAWPGAFVAPREGTELLDALGSEGESVVARARIVHPTPEDEAQVRVLAASAVAGGVTLVSTFQASFPEKGSDHAAGAVVEANEATAPAVTRERVAAWFEAQGISEVPFDEEAQTITLSLQGSPVDIVLRDSAVCEIRVSAALTGEGSASGEPDPAAALHMCNRVNAEEPLATVCVIHHEDGWFVVGSVAVPAGAGLSDAQLDRTIHDGILAAAGAVRAVMHRLG